MEVSASDRSLIEQVTAAMQAGPNGKEQMMALFTDDAVLVEPFAGRPQTHEGKEAVRTRYYEMVAEPRPPDFQLLLDRLDTDGRNVIAEWHCTSVVLPAPLEGVSTYTILDNKIQRLEIQFKGMPG